MTLVGPTARCQQRQNLTFTQRTTRNTPSIQEEGAEHIFIFLLSFILKNLFFTFSFLNFFITFFSFFLLFLLFSTLFYS